MNKKTEKTQCIIDFARKYNAITPCYEIDDNAQLDLCLREIRMKLYFG